MLKISAISDTHNRHNKIKIPEDTDILICCGDISSRGYEHEIRDFFSWFKKQPGKYKIAVMGNHELDYERNLPASKLWVYEECPDVILLNNEAVTIEGINFYGSSVTPFFHNWAFNVNRGQDIKKYWDAILANTNVLITHGPAYGILDECRDGSVGCQDLLEAVERIKPDLHFFGHLHGAHGAKVVGSTCFYNVSICDEMYVASNPVTVVEYENE